MRHEAPIKDTRVMKDFLVSNFTSSQVSVSNPGHLGKKSECYLCAMFGLIIALVLCSHRQMGSIANYKDKSFVKLLAPI